MYTYDADDERAARLAAIARQADEIEEAERQYQDHLVAKEHEQAPPSELPSAPPTPVLTKRFPRGLAGAQAAIKELFPDAVLVNGRAARNPPGVRGAA